MQDDNEFPVELPIEVPEDPLRTSPPEPIGKIRINNHYYDMLEIIFLSQGLVGHGSICYLARKDKEEFVIKDHWVLGGEKEAMNEINMMKKMSGVCGVPTLIKHCLKGTSWTHVHLVLKPCTRPLHKFCSKLELLSSICNIIKIQKEVVEECKVLYHDCSLNNAIIEDDG
ncbi:hypothetical protein BDR06DRAFT_1010528 [Suillus hirtellus]|nr:hypothetical protein BDR06DRAFT_1010528 [Suillus hirtellus]